MKAILFPGQGVQHRGMGRDLFAAYPELTKIASDILGYSIDQLCLHDPDDKLRLTQYTQPALYVVNALTFYSMRDKGEFAAGINYLAGHSLGEYNALLAANVFDFETGLRMVQKRGQLMGEATGGGMAAVLGINARQVEDILIENRLGGIDLANYNTPSQIVIAGRTQAIADAQKVFSEKGIRFVVLNVSAPFHSRYMEEAQREFNYFLHEFEFRDPEIPVIANATARPYVHGKVKNTLGSQIANSVLWTESVRYLMGRGNIKFIEVGGSVLTKMVSEIQEKEAPIYDDHNSADEIEAVDHGLARSIAMPELKFQANKSRASSSSVYKEPFGNIRPETLGSEIFRRRYGLKYAYLSGSMFRGVSSKELVIKMAQANLMGFFGTGGLTLSQIEEGISYIQSRLVNGESYGMNLLANYDNPSMEMETINIFLKHGVRNIEAAAFVRITPALVMFLAKGLRRNNLGRVICNNRILAKVSRPEVATAFMTPAPENIVQKLRVQGEITSDQVEMLKEVPISYDITVEADSGGHTDMGIPTVLLPTMLRLRDELMNKHEYYEPICMGLAGGIGTPESAAAAFLLGADYILTGSINQCTVEAGNSDSVKDLLQEINVQDTDYAPAGDMFETGAKVQVLKKGVFFPARANKLYILYTQYNSLDELPDKVRDQLETRYFRKTLDEIWQETKIYLVQSDKEEQVYQAEKNPKQKMALVFRWYFGFSSRIALAGETQSRVDFQVYTGPALGAFNQWVKGTELEMWRNRHVDKIGEKLMIEATAYLNVMYRRLFGSV